MSKEFCLAIVVNSKYERYIPYFSYFVKKSYPKSNIKIFFTSEISKETSNSLDHLNAGQSIEVINNFFGKMPKSNQELKTFRWLIPQHYFKDHKYVYIGDVDMLICKEDPSLLDFHVEHCNRNGIPYSNCIRPCGKRLSGLHFFETKEYYAAMDSVISEYTDMLKRNKLGLRTGTRNEEVLYDMIVASGMGLPKDEYRVDVDGSGPHHGLHLGIWRSGSKVSKPLENQIIKDSYISHFDYYLRVSKDRGFLGLRKNIPLKELVNMEEFFKKRGL